jgi:hypothetical protein
VPVIAEYASLVAAISILASTVTGALGNNFATLPTSSGTALAAVSAGAKAQGVPPGEARRVYKNAPYSKPILKYLYAIGWVGGKKSSFSCLFARVSRANTEAEAVVEIRKNGKLLRQLKRRGVTAKRAANVLVAGIASACGG